MEQREEYVNDGSFEKTEKATKTKFTTHLDLDNGGVSYIEYDTTTKVNTRETRRIGQMIPEVQELNLGASSGTKSSHGSSRASVSSLGSPKIMQSYPQAPRNGSDAAHGPDVKRGASERGSSSVDVGSQKGQKKRKDKRREADSERMKQERQKWIGRLAYFVT